jgi:3-deoxy-D-manno-octulosonic-acid transferase
MMALPLFLSIYQRLTPFLKRGVLAYVRHRIKKGKEDPKRLNERFGRASVNRPSGPVIWFHGASVGEAVSLLPLLTRIRAEFPHTNILVTTGTVTAANVIMKALPEGCIHQYLPIDLPDWVNAFLDHWQPDFGVFVESELWPNLILNCRSRDIPLYLINAAMSEKSYKSWQRLPSVINHLLSCFEVILAQSQQIADRLINLGASVAKVQVCGNLKFAAKPLDCDQGELTQLQQSLKNRIIWVAASTHSGEEILVSEVHQSLKEHFPNLLTIIIPRHSSRGNQIGSKLKESGFNVAQRSKDEQIVESTDIYLVDTMGELGLFYRLSDAAFIGGTFVPIGGHNPIEAVLLDCAIIMGPHTHKQMEICNVLGPVLSCVSSKMELSSTLINLITNKSLRNDKVSGGRSLVTKQAHIVDYVIDTFRVKLEKKISVKQAQRGKS